jgi:hypothetical protein
MELDVVLVTGELVTINAMNEYADLFRALKGGVNRFDHLERYINYKRYGQGHVSSDVIIVILIPHRTRHCSMANV